MAIEVHDRESGPYAGNGISSQFIIDFYSQSPEHIVVEIIRAGGVVEIAEAGVDYGVTLNDNQNVNPGGFITTSVPLPVGDILFIYSNAPYIQPLDLQQNQAYFTESVEDALDNQNVQIQQLARNVERSLRFARRSLPINPLPVPQPGTVIGIDENGQPYFIPISELGGGGSGGGGCCTPFMNIDGGGAFTTDECYFVNFNWQASEDCVGNPTGPVGPIQPPTAVNPITLANTYSVFAGDTVLNQTETAIAFGAPNDPWGIFVYDRTYEFVNGAPQLRQSPRRIGEWAAPSLVGTMEPSDFTFEVQFGVPPSTNDGTTQIDVQPFIEEVYARFGVRARTTRNIQETRTTNFIVRIRRGSNNELLGQTNVTLTNSHVLRVDGFMQADFGQDGLFQIFMRMNPAGNLVPDPTAGFEFAFGGWSYRNEIGQLISTGNASPFPAGIPIADLALRPKNGGLTFLPSISPPQTLEYIPAAVGDFAVTAGTAGFRVIGAVPNVLGTTRDYFAEFDIVRISTGGVIGSITLSALVTRQEGADAPIGPDAPPTYTVPNGSNLGQLSVTSTTGGVTTVQINQDGSIYIRQSDNNSPTGGVLGAAWVTGDFTPGLFDVRVTGVTGLNILEAPANTWFNLGSGSATFGLEAAAPPASQFRSGSATIQIRLASTGEILAQYPFSALITIG